MRRHELTKMFCQTPSSDSRTPCLCTAWELVLKLGKHGAVSTPLACVFYCIVVLWTLVVFACTRNSTLSTVLDELEHLWGDPVSFPRVLQLHSLHVLSKPRLRSELFKHMPFSPGSVVCFWETGQACYHFFPSWLNPRLHMGVSDLQLFFLSLGTSLGTWFVW